MSGQTLNDRLTAAKHTLAGQGLARIVCKATTEEVIGPKKKHLDYLLHCTNEPNVSIPQLANLLIERTQHSSWVVVFKSLITVHHLMCYGNERFTQYLASSNCTFQLGTFLDKCGVQGYDMSTFIRRYAKYLNEKAVSYRTVAFDFCKCKRGKEDGILRTMNTDKLLKTLPMLQSQLDALLEFDCSSNDLTNGVVNSCFMLLFRDLIRLFACYNDGIINLLEKYFDMNKKHCREALDLYKKFLIRMDRVAEFLKVAENVGIDKGDIPDLTKLAQKCRKLPAFGPDHAPSSLLDALEQHLASLEGRKGSASAAPSTTRVTNVRNAVTALTLTSNAFGSAGESTSPPQEINGVKVDETVRKAVEEEAEVMSQLKFENDSPLLWEQPAWEDSERRMKEITGGEITSPPSGSTKTNPFLSSPSEPGAMGTPTSNQGIIDLFSTPPTSGGGTEEGTGTNASADLLCLSSNPFADSLFGGQTQQQQSQQSQEQITFASFETNGFTSSSTTNAFASEASFAAAFGDTSSTANQGVTTSSVPTGASGNRGSTSTVNKNKGLSRLTLPVLEPLAGRSASPSPTAELMQGAGTTPILSNPPDGFFGDAAEGTEDAAPPAPVSEETSDSIWGTTSMSPSTSVAAAPTTVSANDPFGAPFEPQPPPTSQPPTAIVPPLAMPSSNADSAAKSDLFGFEGNEFSDLVEQPISAQPCAPPPSPFGGLEGLTSVGGSTPDLRTQAMANASVAAGMTATAGPPSGVFSQQLSSQLAGIDDLNFTIQKAMHLPSVQALSGAQSGALSSSLPSAGIMGPRPGFVGQSFPLAATSLPPGSTPPASSSLTRLDNLGGSGQAGTPTGRASSTPGYGTPPSGLSSPAKSVAGFGSSVTGAFDAFGDVLQPQASSGKVGGHDKSGSSSLLKGDLDSTLASLASNLDINGPKQALKKGSAHQWGSPKPAAKTAGSVGWTGPPASVSAVAPGIATGNMAWASSPQHGFQGMAAPSGQWGSGAVIGGPFSQQPAGAGILPQQQFMVGSVRPLASAVPGVPAAMNVGLGGTQPVQQPMFAGISPQVPLVSSAGSALPSQTSVNDPFGAL